MGSLALLLYCCRTIFFIFLFGFLAATFRLNLDNSGLTVLGVFTKTRGFTRKTLSLRSLRIQASAIICTCRVPNPSQYDKWHLRVFQKTGSWRTGKSRNNFCKKTYGNNSKPVDINEGVYHTVDS